MMVPKKSTDIPNCQVLQNYGETGRLSRVRAAGGTPLTGKPEDPNRSSGGMMGA
jgi:hypothetical protein